MCRVAVAALFACSAFLVLSSPPAHGQCSSSGTVSIFDPSVRSAGMGGASTAVFRGRILNEWANPALLGYYDGVAYAWSRMQLVPDLADDVYLISNRLTLGAWGAGFSFAGRPAGIGGERLDYGTNVVTDFSGNVIGEFHSFEEFDSWGFGINAVELAEQLLSSGRSESPISRWGDVSFGYAWKAMDIQLAPASIGRSVPSGQASDSDVGFTLRLTPYDSIDFEHRLGGFDAAIGGMCVDLGFARSTRNREDGRVEWDGEARTDPIERQERWGYSLSVETGFPPAWRERLPRWMAPFLGRLVSFGAAWDDVERTVRRSEDLVDECGKDDYSGFEIGMAGIFTYRRGHVRTQYIDDSAGGWGLGFEVDGIGAFHYDHATVPQGAGQDDLTRHGISGSVDVLGLLDRR